MRTITPFIHLCRMGAAVGVDRLWPSRTSLRSRTALAAENLVLYNSWPCIGSDNCRPAARRILHVWRLQYNRGHPHAHLCPGHPEASAGLPVAPNAGHHLPRDVRVFARPDQTDCEWEQGTHDGYPVVGSFEPNRELSEAGRLIQIEGKTSRDEE